MPVDSITRSQISQANPQTGYFVIRGELEGLANYEPAVGQIFSSLEGTFPNEVGNNIIHRSGTTVYEFTPSHLRTIYRLNYLTVFLPSTTFTLGPTKAGSGETVEVEFAQSWIAVLKIAGAPVFFTEPTTRSTFTLVSKEGVEPSFINQSKVTQIEFTADITSIPGTSIEVDLIPYVEVVRVIKAGKIHGPINNGSLEFTKGVKPTPATLIYDQIFQATRKRQGE